MVDTQLRVYTHPRRSSMVRTRRTYTPEFKTEAVKLVTEQGYSVAEAARSLRTDKGTEHRYGDSVNSRRTSAEKGCREGGCREGVGVPRRGRESNPAGFDSRPLPLCRLFPAGD